jgi:nucleotide-binding universal stress UspA family protein
MGWRIEMTKLLCATDLLPKSESAIERAALVAESLQAKLSLLHVVSPFAPQRVLEQTLQTAIERMRSRVRPPMWRARSKAGAGVLVGNPTRLIVSSLAREEADLLVIGPHGDRGALDSFQDTIAEKVVSARRCPVLVVQRDASTAYKRVLLALDITAESAAALRATERLGLTSSGQAAVVHAYASPQFELLPSAHVELAAIGSHGADLASAVNGAMREFLARESLRPETYELIVAEGRPASTIMRAVESYQPDLLVMGSRGHGRLGRAMAGSVANQLLKEAGCDILIVPHRESNSSLAPSDRAA